MTDGALGLVRFQRWDCLAILHRYQNNNRPAIQLIDRNDHSPIATASINIPQASLAENEVLIKDYAENVGMLQALIDAGIVTQTGRVVKTGWSEGHVCTLTGKGRLDA